MVLLFVVFCFSSRRRHTRCALVTGVQTFALPISVCTAFNSIMWIPHGQAGVVRRVRAVCDRHRAPTAAASSIAPPAWPQKPGTAGCSAPLCERTARTSVVEGKRGSGRVVLGGRRIIKKKHSTTKR